MNLDAEDEDGKAHDQMLNSKEDQHGVHFSQSFGIADRIIYNQMEQI
jgi:hypothetical protein